LGSETSSLKTGLLQRHVGWPAGDPARAIAGQACQIGGGDFVLADQVRRAIAWVYDNAAHLGIDRNQIYIGGQSSGGHLAAVALTTDWPRDFDLPVDIIKGGMCISGMYDLTPVRLSARNAYVAFDDVTVSALSPIRIGDDRSLGQFQI
jgi:arylformamidase